MVADVQVLAGPSKGRPCTDEARFEFKYLVRTDESFAEVRQRIEGDVHRDDEWGLQGAHKVLWDASHPTAAALLFGADSSCLAASNHIAAALWFALVYRHGENLARELLAAHA